MPQKNLTQPIKGMNRSTPPHLLQEGEFLFQKNGNSLDENGFTLSDEHSNLLAVKFADGFKFIGGRNHVVRNRTYIFLTNPETGVSEIGYIENDTNIIEVADTEVESNCTDCPQYVNTEAPPLETVTQVPHQSYTTLVNDECNLCLGFDIDHPIIDILIKEQNIGTKIFWTSTPGKKEFRYIEIDNIEQYQETGSDNCGNEPTPICLDCEKLRVFRLYSELKTINYERIIGGNLQKGSYEILAAYSDQLGNEFTNYMPLSPIIPIFDEANVIHEQEDNNGVTNFAIKLELEDIDQRFDYYRVVVRYYTSKGVFVTFEEGIHNTSDNTIIVSDNNGKSVSNTEIDLVKPFIESVDGATSANNMLILTGVREREPINLQPVMSLAGLAVNWMSFLAKEDLYANANSYKYIGYNRDENQMFSIDFGMDDGYRTNNYIFIPRPATEDELSDFITGDDYDSITDIVGDCDGNVRNKKWQFYNTATLTGACPVGEDIDTVTQTETITTYTRVRQIKLTEGTFEVGKDYVIRSLNIGDDFVNVGYLTENTVFTATATTPTSWTNSTEVINVTDSIPFVPAGTITISLEDNAEFADLESYIEENIETCGNANSPIVDICPYLDLTALTTYNNPPTAQDECDDFELLDEGIIIEAVNNEQSVFNDKPIGDYSIIPPPAYCDIFEYDSDGSFKIDDEFSYAYNVSGYNPLFDTAEICTKFRKLDVYNMKCSSALELAKVNLSNIQTSNYGSFYHLNLGADTSAELQDTKDSTVTSGTRFTSKLHKNALWFKTSIDDRDKFFIEISEETACEMSCVAEGSEIRINIFDRCSDTTPIHSKIIDLSDHHFISVDVENGTLDGSPFDFSTLTNDTLYIAIDVPIVESEGYGEDYADDEDFQNDPPTTRYRLAPLCGCFNIVDRQEEFDSVTITYDSIDVEKAQKWTTVCEYEIPILQDCEPVPYKYGEMGYYESTDKYPDNDELYNSSNLIINKDKITNDDFLDRLRIYTKVETGTQIRLSNNADFRCKNIRAFRMPDNKISPFINTNTLASNSDSIISPLGISIDGEVINNLLDIAVDNELITQEQRDKIVDYRIYRADSTLDRSVVASGLVYNTNTYQVEGEDINYFRYPFNTYGGDKYFHDSEEGEFDKFQTISPEFDYFRPSLPNEMSIQGFMYGKANMRVLPVEEHARMVILGKKARTLATVLASFEAAAELAIQIAQAGENFRVSGGFVFSANPVGIGLSIAAASLGLIDAVTQKVGRYRLEWLRSFENLGSPHNFGHYIASGSKYNYLKTLQTDGDRLRGLSTRKYLKSGMLNVSDTTTGSVTRINNIDREESAFFSLGNYPIENLDPDYTNFDNNDTSPNFSSQIISSEIGCHNGKSPEQLRNIASPYVAFKNYVVNQYGTVDSIRWIDTTYTIPIENTGICNGILGGDTFISRHSKKRKVRLFEADMLGLADLTPFSYEYNSNYGQPRFFVDYKVNGGGEQVGSKLFPNIFYEYNFDCHFNTNTFYVEPPAKFYLYSISYINFLCETRVNTNFRNARKEPWNQFYPQNSDYETISQPNTVALTRPEEFFYNKAYLQTNTLTSKFILPDYYSKEDESKKAYNPNSGVYSLPDANENSITEPWLMYRPNDAFTLESKYGRLVNMKGIESDQLLMYFEDAMQLQNAVNQFTDGDTKYSSELGNGGMFAKRALTIRSTDIGYGGSQSKHTLSCEFGHFHADVKRGQVFNYTGGKPPLEEISRYSNGKPNGMDIWFKKHLPLKLLRYFPNYDRYENPYNGMGIHWGYDSKYKRVILTKKDYIPINKSNELQVCGGKIYNFNIEDYQDIIDNYTSQGYTYEGIEECKLKFIKDSKSITTETDIYAYFDTTSMTIEDATAAKDGLENWFSNFQIENPSYTGNLYTIPTIQERYLLNLSSIQSGATQFPNLDTSPTWAPFVTLPPNANTPSFIPPNDLLALVFIDESDPPYHNNSINSFSGQPTVGANSFTGNYMDFKSSVINFDNFRAVFYPVVRFVGGFAAASQNMILHLLAVIEGTTLTTEQIAETGTTVNVNAITSSNPYEGYIMPDSSTFVPLKEYGAIGFYNKVSPATEVFSSDSFQEDLGSFTNIGESFASMDIVYVPLEEILLTDENYFKDVSWTITYKPETGGWESYMDYKPNYYINHSDYFQSGMNTNDSREGLWSHLLTNKSYRVFYGQKFPYVFEYIEKNQYIAKRLEDLSWNAQLRRYHNEYDYAPIEANPFDAVTIYNDYENSGRLIPNLSNGTLSQQSKYPKTNSDNTQEVLVNYDDYRYNMNYFYNRVKSNRNNQPIWIWDENQIEKMVNPKAVSFYGKPTLERMQGNYFIVRLERNGNTNYDLDFRWSEQTVNPIR